MRPLASIVALALTGGAVPASAASITLNGVNIDGVTSQRFENCTVTIDAQGDVHIEAKGYAVKTGGTPAPAAPAAPAARTVPAARAARTVRSARAAGAAGARVP
ncbi:MAG TPA: hypothetical protein VF841_03420, partial [Anaeromyxobacter sp.]